MREFFRRLAYTLEPSGLDHRQFRIGDVPEDRRDLVACDEVFDLRATNPWPTFDIAELQVEDVGDLRREVLDVDVPVAVVGGAKRSFVSLSRITKRMSWTVPTLSTISLPMLP
jgi:hypothetical protein